MRDLQQSYAAQCAAIQQQQVTSTSAARHKRGNVDAYVKAVVAKPRTLSDYLASISSQAPQGLTSSTSSQAMPAGADATSAQYDDMNVHEDEENEYESFMAEESASRLGVQALLDQAALQDAQNLLTAAQQQADQLAQADQDRRDARQQQAQLAATELARQQQAAQDDHNRREARQYQAQMAAEQLAADAARQQQQQHVQPPTESSNKRAGLDTSPSARIRSRPRLAATNLSDDDYDDDDQLSIDFYASSKNRSDSSKKRAYPGARTRGGSTRRNTATVFSSSGSDVSSRRDVIGRTVVDLISDVDSSGEKPMGQSFKQMCLTPEDTTDPDSTHPYRLDPHPDIVDSDYHYDLGMSTNAKISNMVTSTDMAYSVSSCTIIFTG